MTYLQKYSRLKSSNCWHFKKLFLFHLCHQQLIVNFIKLKLENCLRIPSCLISFVIGAGLFGSSRRRTFLILTFYRMLTPVLYSYCNEETVLCREPELERFKKNREPTKKKWLFRSIFLSIAIFMCMTPTKFWILLTIKMKNYYVHIQTVKSCTQLWKIAFFGHFRMEKVTFFD